MSAEAERPFPPLDPQSLDEAQRALAAQLLRASKGHGGGPIPLLLRSPAMSERLRPLITYLNRESPLPARLRELAILIQAKHWNQDYEWWAHHALARDAGLSDELIDALAAGHRPPSMRSDEAAVYDLCIELLAARSPSRRTVDAVKADLSDAQIMDLVAVGGVYALLAMLLNLAGETAPAGAEQPEPGAT